MHRLSVLLAAAALLTACPGPAPKPPDGGEPPDAGPMNPPDAGPVNPPDAGPQIPSLFTVSGPLEVASGITVPAHLHVGVLWFRTLDTTDPKPLAATESGPSLGESLPARWSFDVRAEPPMAARSEFTSPGGGTGDVSWGALVLFRDRDGDGKLTVAPDGSTSDEVLGSSAGAVPFDADGPGERAFILWRKGTIGSDEAGVKAGFNVVRMVEPFAKPSVVPSSMDLPLRLSNDPRGALMFCPPAYLPINDSGELPESACGQRLFRTPRVTAIAMAFEEGITIANVGVKAGPRSVGDAKVLLNGVVVPADTEGTYTLFELVPSVLRPGKNTVRVEAPQHEALELELTFPAAPALVQPANAQLKSNQAQLVKWTAVPGASSYDVSLAIENQDGFYVTTQTNEAELQVPAATGPATLTVGVMAITPVPRHMVMGTASVNVPVTLVP